MNSCNRDLDKPGEVICVKDNWKHRSKGMACRTCMWFVEKKRDFLDELAKEKGETRFIGRCRKHAPTMNGYPVVFTTDFCGDHKLDENKL